MVVVGGLSQHGQLPTTAGDRSGISENLTPQIQPEWMGTGHRHFRNLKHRHLSRLILRQSATTHPADSTASLGALVTSSFDDAQELHSQVCCRTAIMSDHKFLTWIGQVKTRFKWRSTDEYLGLFQNETID
jgi:hypothetical protein